MKVKDHDKVMTSNNSGLGWVWTSGIGTETLAEGHQKPGCFPTSKAEVKGHSEKHIGCGSTTWNPSSQGLHIRQGSSDNLFVSHKKTEARICCSCLSSLLTSRCTCLDSDRNDRQYNQHKATPLSPLLGNATTLYTLYCTQNSPLIQKMSYRCYPFYQAFSFHDKLWQLSR